MEYSAGIILYKKEFGNTYFFVCTPGGPFWEKRELWNFPKGHIDNGESRLDAAIREFKEETSIDLCPFSTYRFLGNIKQNKHKTVSVFAKKYDGEDTKNCKSIMCKTVIKGKEFIHSEIKGYAWMTYDELIEKGMKCYLNIYKMLLEDD